MCHYSVPSFCFLGEGGKKWKGVYQESAEAAWCALIFLSLLLSQSLPPSLSPHSPCIGDLWVSVAPLFIPLHSFSSARLIDQEQLMHDGHEWCFSSLPPLHFTHLHTQAGSHPWTAVVKMRNITWRTATRASSQTHSPAENRPALSAASERASFETIRNVVCVVVMESSARASHRAALSMTDPCEIVTPDHPAVCVRCEGGLRLDRSLGVTLSPCPVYILRLCLISEQCPSLTLTHKHTQEWGIRPLCACVYIYMYM